MNLLLNASAAAGRGGRIGLDVHASQGSLTLTVRDDGPGMDAASLARLTGRAPPPTGGGLGLRVVRELTLALGGRIAHAREDARTVIDVTFGGEGTP